jgi:hypothetical protein
VRASTPTAARHQVGDAHGEKSLYLVADHRAPRGGVSTATARWLQRRQGHGDVTDSSGRQGLRVGAYAEKLLPCGGDARLEARGREAPRGMRRAGQGRVGRVVHTASARALRHGLARKGAWPGHRRASSATRWSGGTASPARAYQVCTWPRTWFVRGDTGWRSERRAAALSSDEAPTRRRGRLTAFGTHRPEIWSL